MSAHELVACLERAIAAFAANDAPAAAEALTAGELVCARMPPHEFMKDPALAERAAALHRQVSDMANALQQNLSSQVASLATSRKAQGAYRRAESGA